MSAIKRLWEDITLEHFGRVDPESLEKSKPIVEHILKCWSEKCDCGEYDGRQNDSRTNPS